jgi:predicted aminopeptidase
MLMVLPGMLKRLKTPLIAVMVLLLTGCDSLGYYTQALGGQLDLMRKGESLQSLLDDAATTESLRSQLELVERLLEFAEHELGLPADGQYSHYVDLGRPYVVWNVFAAEELSLQAKTWCHPVVGCAAYRGYFDQQDAESHAKNLSDAGMDTFVGGVAAYSTLGWFKDPVLSSFVYRPEARLADLIFHELAHQVVFIPGDTMFNESFATAVAREGVRLWLQRPGKESVYRDYQISLQQQADFIDLVQNLRQKLDELYALPVSDVDKQERKRNLITGMRNDYEQLKREKYPEPADSQPYDGWMYSPVNNAKVNSVSAYHQLVPPLKNLLRQEGSLSAFYARCRSLSELSPEQREEVLLDALR